MKNRPQQHGECCTAMNDSPQILHSLAAAAASSLRKIADCIWARELFDIDALVAVDLMKTLAVVVACVCRCADAFQGAT